MIQPKIYKIVDCENGETYIGSTKQKYISKRISRHREATNTCSSKMIINNNNYIYELVEICDFDNIKERERFHINNTENCINKNKLNGLNKERKNLRNKLYMRQRRATEKKWGDLYHIQTDIF
jgi:predicted GIY-YIG superfamily endonuclease